jgi:hypothetical protein
MNRGNQGGKGETHCVGVGRLSLLAKGHELSVVLSRKEEAESAVRIVRERRSREGKQGIPGRHGSAACSYNACTETDAWCVCGCGSWLRTGLRRLWMRELASYEAEAKCGCGS